MENVFWQRCNGCGEEFRLRYKEDGDYDYMDMTCSCEDSFSPLPDEPSISQWLEQKKKQKVI